MINIRYGVFETNSSSVHSLTILSKKNYDLYVKGEVFIFRGTIVSKNELTDEVKDYVNRYYGGDFEEFFTEFSYDNQYRNTEFETFKQEHTTDSGDVIVAFGYFGTDR